jgi:aminopeptidase YwaD
MPKNFPFYNPDHQQAIIRLLEKRAPAAIIAATTRDETMVGSQYPFPLFEDGDFDIPSVYMTAEEGARLAAAAVGRPVSLTSTARRIPSTGEAVTARLGASRLPRIVVFAHIDSRMGTPGANDNASGTTTLLLLAELLAGYAGRLGVELVAVNGEDYYAASGEVLWVASNSGKYDEILLGINLDDVGYRKGRSAYSLYGCSEAIAGATRGAFRRYPSIVEGDAWYQGDHMLFVANQVPAVAVTDELVAQLMRGITHTERDTIDIVDPGKLASLATALHDLVLILDAGSQ